MGNEWQKTGICPGLEGGEESGRNCYPAETSPSRAAHSIASVRVRSSSLR